MSNKSSDALLEDNNFAEVESLYYDKAAALSMQHWMD